MTLHQPLELEYWFVNVFSGSQSIFVFISIIFFTWLAAYMRMPTGVYAMMLVVFLLILSQIGLAKGIFIIVLLICSGIFYWYIKKPTE